MSVAPEAAGKSASLCPDDSGVLGCIFAFKVVIQIKRTPLCPGESVIVSILLVLHGDPKHALCGFKGRESCFQPSSSSLVRLLHVKFQIINNSKDMKTIFFLLHLALHAAPPSSFLASNKH